MNQSLNSSMDKSLNESENDEDTNALGMSEFGINTKENFQEVDLRSVYIKNYGVEMELPAFYISSAKIVPHRPDHIVVLAWHVIPKSFYQSI